MLSRRNLPRRNRAQKKCGARHTGSCGFKSTRKNCIASHAFFSFFSQCSINQPCPRQPNTGHHVGVVALQLAVPAAGARARGRVQRCVGGAVGHLFRHAGRQRGGRGAARARRRRRSPRVDRHPPRVPLPSGGGGGAGARLPRIPPGSADGDGPLLPPRALPARAFSVLHDVFGARGLRAVGGVLQLVGGGEQNRHPGHARPDHQV